MTGRAAKVHLPRFHVHLGGQGQLDQMAHGGGDDVLFVFKRVVLALELTQRARKIGGNAGFFRQ